jgi:hypothetical protein
VPAAGRRVQSFDADGSELLVDAASRRGLPEPGVRVSVRATGEHALLAGDGAAASEP